MKKLVIVRHAKAEPTEPGNTDFNRKLSQRGIDEATQIAKKTKPLLKGSIALLASPAKRALDTASIFADIFEINVDYIFKEHMLYGNYSIEDLKVLFSSIGFNHDNVILFGHNPAIGEIVDQFTNQFSHHLPTSGVIMMDLNIEKWEELKKNCGKITHIEQPIK